MSSLSSSPGIKMLVAEFSQNERLLWSIAVFSGILMCKIVYDVTGWISLSYFKGYNRLSEAVKVEWNNRGFSTFHAFLVAFAAFYLLLLSDVFRNNSHGEHMINRKSTLSDTILGVSIGYFLSNLGMILWSFPSLGGKEYLDVAGQKNSKLYVYNGIALFLWWLVARILLFILFFTHIYMHFDQVKMVFPLGFYSLLVAPSMLAAVHFFWFWKIVKGLMKTLSKARHRS